MNLILFYDDGYSVKFNDVSNLKLYDDRVEFNYFDIPNKVHRFGYFKNFIGFAKEYDTLGERRSNAEKVVE